MWVFYLCGEPFTPKASEMACTCAEHIRLNLAVFFFMYLFVVVDWVWALDF